MKKGKIIKPTILFIIFAFSIPLVCVTMEKNVNIFESGILNFILFGVEAASPTISALIVTIILSGSIGVSEFLKKCYIHNIKIQYIIFAAIIPISVFTMVKLLMVIFMGSTFTIARITTKKLLIVCWALIAEEIGWRGFLQEKIDKHFEFLLTPLIVGSIWALWHYHFFLLGTMSAPILLFAAGCITDSYVLYWVTKKSKYNVIPASIFHFTENLFLIGPEYNNGNIQPYVFYIISSAVISFGITLWGYYSEKRMSL